MTSFVTCNLLKRIRPAVGVGSLMVSAFGVMVGAQAQPQAARSDASKWITFTSRAGWHIRYPPDLHVSSCQQCNDPTKAGAIVAFSRRSGEVLAMIEPLADKNLAQTSQQWLSDVARDTVIAPILSEEWTSIDGAPMLVVFNGATNSDKTENIYVLHGVRTFALRFPYIQDAATRSLCQRMLATFRFASSRK